MSIFENHILLLDNASQVLAKVTKPTAFGGSFCGFIYLVSYTHHVGIPFPLELSLLPTLLLFIGLVAGLGVALVAGGILVPGLVADDPKGVIKQLLLAKDISERRFTERIKRYFIYIWSPIFLAILLAFLPTSLFDIPFLAKCVGVLFAILGLAIIRHVSLGIPLLKDRFFDYLGITAVQMVFSTTSYCLLILVTMAVFPDVSVLPEWGAMILVLIIFTFIHFFVMIPIDKGIREGILLPPNFKHEPSSAAGLVLIFISAAIALSAFSYPFNANVGGAALRFFGTGGGIPATICLKSLPAKSIATRFGFGADSCSKPLQILLDAGDRLYVANIGEAKNAPVYFRQDEVRQKTYLPASEKPIPKARAVKLKQREQG